MRMPTQPNIHSLSPHSREGEGDHCPKETLWGWMNAPDIKCGQGVERRFFLTVAAPAKNSPKVLAKLLKVAYKLKSSRKRSTSTGAEEPPITQGKSARPNVGHGWSMFSICRNYAVLARGRKMYEWQRQNWKVCKRGTTLGKNVSSVFLFLFWKVLEKSWNYLHNLVT